MLFLWVSLYGLVLSAMAAVSDHPWIRGILPAVFSAAFLCWVVKTGRKQQAGLGRFQLHSRKETSALLLLLLVMPLYNLICGGGTVLAAPLWLEMLGICTAEELFFRGFLLSRLSNRDRCRGVVLTSLIFSLMHLVNFQTAGDSLFVGLQVISSFLISICYCVVTLRFGNLLPCVAAHFLTNVFGITGAEGTGMITGLLICMAVHGLWVLGLCCEIGRKTNEILH